MFKLSALPRVNYTPILCNCIVRYSRFKARVKRNRDVDPGIRLTNSLFSDKQLGKLDSANYDDLEADFNSLNLSYKEHMDEMGHMREREKHLIVKRKYFKEKFPNYLTWADKQQIKHLHSKNPDEWTFEKLSEGFPALPETVQKVIKANWTPENSDKIKRHDRSVQKNWFEFKEGKMESLPAKLNEHLRKFTNRALNLNPVELPGGKADPADSLPQGGEFSAIITSYKKLKQGLSPATIKIEAKERKPLKEMYVEGENTEHKSNMTLFAFKRELEKKSVGRNLNEAEKMIVNFHEQEKIEVKEIELNIAKYVNNTAVTSVKKMETDYNHLNYPEKILIPKDQRKRGCTYKLNDCYYDDDGEFLYRVPGM